MREICWFLGAVVALLVVLHLLGAIELQGF